MSDIVYNVNGGYEDWAYGGSWDKNNIPKQCNGKKYYIPEESNRALTFLVEAGPKIPSKDSGGNSLEIFNP